jgi:hypothetical protein
MDQTIIARERREGQSMAMDSQKVGEVGLAKG